MARNYGSIQEFFADIDSNFKKDKAAGVSAVYQFAFSGPGGGDIHLVITDGEVEVVEGKHAKPNTTYSVSAENYLKIINGQLSGRRAALTRKMKVSGSIPFALKMEKFLPPPK